ncbi:hypothetical protein B6107_18795 [Salmonella enterica]|nr:hypothetical protein [Salmonella enterica]
MCIERLFVHAGDLWRFNTPLSCLQPPQQGKTLVYTVLFKIFPVLQVKFCRFPSGYCSAWKNRCQVIHKIG